MGPLNILAAFGYVIVVATGAYRYTYGHWPRVWSLPASPFPTEKSVSDFVRYLIRCAAFGLAFGLIVPVAADLAHIQTNHPAFIPALTLVGILVGINVVRRAPVEE